MHLHCNNSFINRTQLPLLCEKSGAILLVLVGLTAGRQAVRQNIGRFKNSKNFLQITSEEFLVFNKGTALFYVVLPMHFSRFFG